MGLESRPYVLDPSESFPFHVSATRYWWNDSRAPDEEKETGVKQENGLTLIAAHATGSHKESWEPVLDLLFPLAEAEGVLIIDVWAIDAPNHGDACSLNGELLPPDRLPFDAYAQTINRFLTTFPVEGNAVDFRRRKLVGLGHCFGAASIVYLQQDPSFQMKFQGMVLIEVLAEPPGLKAPWEIAITGSYLKADTWPTRKDAYIQLRKDPVYSLWPDKCLELFVQHGIKDHPASMYNPFPWHGVTVKCTRSQEAATYRGIRTIAQRVPDLLPAIAREIPVHCIWAGINPRIYKDIQIAVEAACNIPFASIQKVPNAGHLVIQNNPEGAAGTAFNALKDIAKSFKSVSRL